MQKYPHCFELAAARGQLDTLDMQGLTRDASALVVTKTRFSFSGWKVDSADLQDYIAEGELSESLLQGLFIVLRDRFPKTAYMFPPHLLRTSNLSRTLAQPRLKQQSTPQSLPSVALFPYRTTKSRHWVLYALIRQDETPTTERLLLFKRSSVPSAALDWANKYIQKTFAASIEEQELPDKSFTDVSVFFSAVALAAGVDFTTMTPVAERAVGELATFFQSLLDDNARSQVSDVHLLSTRNDSIRDFLQIVACPVYSECDGSVFAGSFATGGFHTQRQQSHTQVHVLTDNSKICFHGHPAFAVTTLWFFETPTLPHKRS